MTERERFHPAVGLDLNALRGANVARIPTFKNRKGEPAHAQPDGSDWTFGDWFMAMAGEAGELGNLLKKVQRGDVSLADARAEIAKEFADVLIYLDILAFRCGVSLSDATVAKFNEVSVRVGSPIRLTTMSWTDQRDQVGGAS